MKLSPHRIDVGIAAVSEGGLEPDGFTLRIADLGVLSVKSGSIASRWSLLHPAMCPPWGCTDLHFYGHHTRTAWDLIIVVRATRSTQVKLNPWAVEPEVPKCLADVG